MGQIREVAQTIYLYLPRFPSPASDNRHHNPISDCGRDYLSCPTKLDGRSASRHSLRLHPRTYRLGRV